MELNGVIQRKLAPMDKYLGELESRVANVSRASFREDWMLQRMCERALQVVIEVCVDVAERLLATTGGGPAATAAEAFEKLERQGIIADAQRYISMVRFRNVIVHQYEEVDPEILYTVVTERLADFRRFRDELDAQ